MHQTIDLTDLPIDAAMAVAGREFLAAITAGLVQVAMALGATGLSIAEMNVLLERHRAELEDWRVKSLAELRGWLERDGQSLN
jgi:Na+/glutamate symporter